MRRPGIWPVQWVGTWAAADGKTVYIMRTGQGVAVTVAPGAGHAPYLSAEALDGSAFRIDQCPGSCWIDAEQRIYLEIEAGTAGVGPTYRLYPCVQESGRFHRPGLDVAAGRLVFLPNTSIGLYDDWEDDLGVPWAYPLEPLRWTPDP